LLLEGGLTGHWETPFGMGEPARRSPPQPIGEYSSKASRRPGGVSVGVDNHDRPLPLARPV